jgi:hypothetical protein
MLYGFSKVYRIPEQLWQHKAPISLPSVVSAADGKCIWQKQEATVSVAESIKKKKEFLQT